MEKVISKGHRTLAKRLICLARGHQWRFQRKGNNPGPAGTGEYTYLPESRFMCDRCGRCESWVENDEWKPVMQAGIPPKPVWVYGYIPEVGQIHLYFNGTHFFHPVTRQMEIRITHWRMAYPNP